MSKPVELLCSREANAVILAGCCVVFQYRSSCDSLLISHVCEFTITIRFGLPSPLPH